MPHQVLAEELEDPQGSTSLDEAGILSHSCLRLGSSRPSKAASWAPHRAKPLCSAPSGLRLLGRVLKGEGSGHACQSAKAWYMAPSCQCFLRLRKARCTQGAGRPPPHSWPGPAREPSPHSAPAPASGPSSLPLGKRQACRATIPGVAPGQCPMPLSPGPDQLRLPDPAEVFRETLSAAHRRRLQVFLI